jgi:hypothetical protein
MRKPKKPKKTAEEKAGEIRVRSLLDKEIEEEEDRFRMLSRGKLGKASMLGGAAKNRKAAASGKKSSTSSVTSSASRGSRLSSGKVPGGL